jgi:hypothetical protein
LAEAFDRTEQEISQIFNQTLDLILDNWQHLLDQHPLLSDQAHQNRCSQAVAAITGMLCLVT